MGLARFLIYKYVKTNKGWRYYKPAYSTNNKIKPHVVLVDGKEEPHPEGDVPEFRYQWKRESLHHSFGL